MPNDHRGTEAQMHVEQFEAQRARDRAKREAHPVYQDTVLPDDGDADQDPKVLAAEHLAALHLNHSGGQQSQAVEASRVSLAEARVMAKKHLEGLRKHR